MRVTIGKEGLTKTWQEEFPEEKGCAYCDGDARIAFVAHEGLEEEERCKLEREKYICAMHENKPGEEGYWIHDSCAVAVYFCKKCLRPTASMNQG